MTYYVTASDGTDIAYDCMGEGPPVLLIHGFGANRAITWANTNWYQTLQRPAANSSPSTAAAMASRRSRTIRPITTRAAWRWTRSRCWPIWKFPRPTSLGYSMGASLAIRLMHDAPGRVRRAVLGGLSENYFRSSKEMSETIAQGLLARDPSTIADPVAREFRSFCEKAGDDLQAMAACMRRPRRKFPAEELHALPQKVLVVCGAEDNLAGSPEALAGAFRDGQALVVPKRNHHSTVGDRIFKDAAVAFLGA